MLDFLKRIFGGQGGRGAPEGDLARLEEELRKVGQGRDSARLANRAGDLYLVKGERERALQRYGTAIDNYLHAGEYDNAMAVCRKIIRVVPEVIRTRRTLAWLCLGKGFLEIAREHIDAYVQASREAELHSLAVQQLLLMAQFVDREDFRLFLVEKLEELGEHAAAESVRKGHAKDAVRNAGWSAVVFAAMLTPEEMRMATERGVEIHPPAADAGTDEFEDLLFDPEAAAKAKQGGEGEADGGTKEG